MKIRRRYIFVVVFNVLGLAALACLAFFGVYAPAWQFPDVYAPYIFIVGPVAFVFGGWFSLWLAHVAPWWLPAQERGALFIIILPAVFDCILGILQDIALIYAFGLLLDILKRISNRRMPR